MPQCSYRTPTTGLFLKGLLLERRLGPFQQLIMTSEQTETSTTGCYVIFSHLGQEYLPGKWRVGPRLDDARYGQCFLMA